MTAQDKLFAKYGDPRNQLAYQSKYCIIWNVSNEYTWFPQRRLLINKDFKDKLSLVFRKLTETGLYKEIRKSGGCFEPRNSRTTGLLSLHYWAAALDLNPDTERLGSKTTHWTPEFIKCFTDQSLFWGGNFHGTKDPMHFALLDG